MDHCVCCDVLLAALSKPILYKLLYQSAVLVLSAVSYFCCLFPKEKKNKTNDMVCWHWYVRCVDDAIYVSWFFIFVLPFSSISIAIRWYVVRFKCRVERAPVLLITNVLRFVTWRYFNIIVFNHVWMFEYICSHWVQLIWINLCAFHFNSFHWHSVSAFTFHQSFHAMYILLMWNFAWKLRSQCKLNSIILFGFWGKLKFPKTKLKTENKS